ncbi:MAG TPA: hypothetical protein VK690_08220 [Stellaceae bacterium]|nr:hypothetical protein [Stellaceae bacterium]
MTAIAFLVSAAALAVMTASPTSPFQTPPQVGSCPSCCAAQCLGAPVGFRERLVSDPVAIFTLLLALGTFWLGFISNKAASAAKAAAEALPIVERAYVYPVVVSVVGMAEYIDESTIYFLNPDQIDKPRPETRDIAFKIKNYGKTPAILKSVFAGLGVWPIGAEIGLSIPEATLGPMDITSDFTAAMQVGLTRNQAKHILAYEAHLGFSGTIVFDDIWGNENTTTFLFVWDNEIKRMALRGVETKIKQKGE